MNKHYLLTVSQVQAATDQAVHIRFGQPAGERIHYKPGQFITLAVPIGGNYHYRCYSLCSAPKLDDELGIVVKRVKGGLVSNYLNDSVRAGMQMEVIEPAGRFIVDNSVKFQRHFVLIGGGSGITPLISILRSILFNEPRSSLSLIYANHDEHSIIFREELAALQQMFAQRFKLTHVLSAPVGTAAFPYVKGRLNAGRLRSLLQAEASGREALYYLCGPEGLLELSLGVLADMQLPAERIHIERFTAPPPAEYKGDGKLRQMRLQHKGQSYLVQVPSGTSLLDAALAQGIPLPYSCKSGICATCMARLTKGEVQLQRDEALLDFERRQGRILLCQAHPLSPLVEVET